MNNLNNLVSSRSNSSERVELRVNLTRINVNSFISRSARQLQVRLRRLTESEEASFTPIRRLRQLQQRLSPAQTTLTSIRHRHRLTPLTVNLSRSRIERVIANNNEPIPRPISPIVTIIYPPRMVTPTNSPTTSNYPINQQAPPRRSPQLIIRLPRLIVTVNDPQIIRAPQPLPRVRRVITCEYALNLNEHQIDNICANDKHDLGLLDEERACTHCGALFFERDNRNRAGQIILCCQNGKVQLPPLKAIPEDFQNLCKSTSTMGIEFRTNIRTINSLFAMATF